MKTIKQKYHIEAPIEKVWKSLIDPSEIDGWGGGPAEMDGKIDTEFSLWGGDIHGKNIEALETRNSFKSRLVENGTLHQLLL